MPLILSSDTYSQILLPPTNVSDRLAELPENSGMPSLILGEGTEDQTDQVTSFGSRSRGGIRIRIHLTPQRARTFPGLTLPPSNTKMRSVITGPQCQSPLPLRGPLASAHNHPTTGPKPCSPSSLMREVRMCPKGQPRSHSALIGKIDCQSE